MAQQWVRDSVIDAVGLSTMHRAVSPGAESSMTQCIPALAATGLYDARDVDFEEFLPHV
jgi:hypothetical protein